MKNTNGNAAILLIIAMLILGLIIFSIGNQGTGSRVKQPVTKPTSEYNKPHSSTRNFDLQIKKAEVHGTIHAGIRTIDKALTELAE